MISSQSGCLRTILSLSANLKAQNAESIRAIRLDPSRLRWAVERRGNQNFLTSKKMLNFNFLTLQCC